MTVERMFKLVTDCLVCMGFSFLRFGLVFPACLLLCRFMCVSGKGD